MKKEIIVIMETCNCLFGSNGKPFQNEASLATCSALELSLNLTDFVAWELDIEDLKSLLEVLSESQANFVIHSLVDCVLDPRVYDEIETARVGLIIEHVRNWRMSW